MGKRYFLCDGRFSLRVQDGILVFAGAAGDCYQTSYPDGKKGFGNIYLAWEQDGEVKEWQPLMSGDYRDSMPVRKGRSMRYGGSAEKGGLRVNVGYFLEDEILRQEITVENVGVGSFRLRDFGIRLSCHTQFVRGGDTGREVIGHHFISGHGSHSTFYRCDGKGQILGVMPSGGSKWIHYENEGEEKGNAVLYSLNGFVGKKRKEEGARLRAETESVTLNPGESYRYHGRMFFARDYEDCRGQFIRNGQAVAESVPGYTVPKELPVLLAVRCAGKELLAESEDAAVEVVRREAGVCIWRLTFCRPGERRVRIHFDGKYMDLYYFITEGIRTMMEKRAAFLAGMQIRNPKKWYDGLFPEFNNETGTVLSPDCYDRISGWRVYEVTCDDPGLSKPAYLSSFQTVEPVQEQVDALDYYIEHFVWGGLQQTEDEPFPYGVYGIPDWNTLRWSETAGVGGRAHLWRIYDYPHIALLYYNMYEAAAFAEGIHTKLDARTYLSRAYHTARTMFTLPLELEGWSAYETGLYNELVIPKIIDALEKEGMETEAGILRTHWDRKAVFFAGKCKDIFESEYPFDTTGFESTHVLALRGLALARILDEAPKFGDDVPYSKAVEFMENQIAANIACRGLLEPAYFWYGSDYRGDNLHYTLSYMTQMGGSSLLDYACFHARNPFGLLRLGYGSLLGGWAVLNTGEEKDGYGYWYPGKEKDGCACGGFEPLYGGMTWLGQPHHGNVWYYSCEADLGFCGGIRGASVIAAQDPLFGLVCYGGLLREEPEGIYVDWRDGLGRRFHYIGETGRIHAECVHGRWIPGKGIFVGRDAGRIVLEAESGSWKKESLCVRILAEGLGDYRLKEDGRTIRDGEWAEIRLPSGSGRLVLDSCQADG